MSAQGGGHVLLRLLEQDLRALSDVRDADVLLETYDRLAAAEPVRLDRGATYTVRAHLVELRRTAQSEGGDLADRLGEAVRPQRRNVSPEVEAPLSNEMEAAFVAARPAEWALYEAVMTAGGHLVTEVPR